MAKSNKKIETITFTEIYERNVWTKKMIRENLVPHNEEQDETGKKIKRRVPEAQRNYLLNDVLAFEQTEYFQEKFMYSRKDLLTLTAVIARDGWTKKKVETLLGVADCTKDNPVFKCASPMQLYTPERVEAAEKTEAFLESFQRNVEHRKKCAEKTTANHKSKINIIKNKIRILGLKLVNNEVFIKTYMWEDLLNKIGVKDTNINQLETINNLSKNTKRMLVNLIRHEHTNYEDLMDKTSCYSHPYFVEVLFRLKVYYVIAKTYRALSGECCDQLKSHLTVLPKKMWRALLNNEQAVDDLMIDISTMTFLENRYTI